jgi:amino acid transporter
VVTIDTIGAVTSNGAQGFTWLIFLGVFFFLPYALSVAELGSAFPQEGEPYVWSLLAFGRPLTGLGEMPPGGGWIIVGESGSGAAPAPGHRVRADSLAGRDRGHLPAETGGNCPQSRGG